MIILLTIIIGLSLVIYKGIKWEKLQEEGLRSKSVISKNVINKNLSTNLSNTKVKEETLREEHNNIKISLIKARKLGDSKKFDESLKLLDKLQGLVNSNDSSKENNFYRIQYLKQIMLNRKQDMKNVASYPVNILMYHSIAYEKGNNLRIPKDAFRAELLYLKEKGYEFSTMREYAWRRENKIPFSKNTVIVTLDDGYKDNYTSAFPIFKELQVPATIFAITSTTDKNNAYINSDDMKEMDDCFIDIESHTVSHKDLGTMPYKDQASELKDSKEFLEEKLQRPVEIICYPSGKFNNDTLKAVKEVYKLGVTTQPGADKFYEEPYKLHRIRIETPVIDSFKAIIKNYWHN